MSLIKHLEDNINGAVSYEYAISVGKAYKTKDGGHPRETTIARKLRNLVEDGKLETVRNGKTIIGYKQIQSDIVEDYTLSNCCGAEINDFGMCCECGEHCISIAEESYQQA